MLLDFLFFILGHVLRIIIDIVSIIASPFIFLYYGYKSNNFIKTKQFKSVLITGGSSGIGKAIALELVSQNPQINIIITGTNKGRLASAVTALERQQEQSTSSSDSGKIVSQLLDVRNRAEMKEFILKMDSQYELDLIIANAGTSAGMCDAPHYFVSSEPILDINCQGVLNTILPIIPKYQERKSGHIAVVGSLGGYLPQCQGGSYNASKAYVRFLCDDLRPKLKMIGNIDLSYIAPGYVGSRMQTDKTKMGFMSAKDAAKIVVSELKSNHKIIMFPSHVGTLAWWLGSLHPILSSLVMDRSLARHEAAQSVGFFHEFDPNDEFGGEC